MFSETAAFEPFFTEQVAFVSPVKASVAACVFDCGFSENIDSEIGGQSDVRKWEIHISCPAWPAVEAPRIGAKIIFNNLKASVVSVRVQDACYVLDVRESW